jgi:histidyl-tRNA synthetase
MAVKIKPRLMKGVRDFLPGDMIKRNYVINKITTVFNKHGFLQIETPAIEMWETLSGKYGEEGDQLTYKFTDRGERELGLRYDLTVPLSRLVAMHQNEIVRPFKRYQIQPVWRADKPGKGRFREFFQCDIDIVGSKDLLADAEVIQISYEILQSLGFKNYKIRINSRKVLRGMVEVSGCGIELEMDICRSIDKLDKIGPEGVRQELRERGISDQAIEKIEEITEIKGNPQEVILRAHTKLRDSKVGQEGVEELSELRKILEAMGVGADNFEIDLSLARGLDYYTGPIFETIVEKPRIGSLSGGGRYDRLIGQFSGQDIPAVGNSLGLERIITVMDELNMYPEDLGLGIDVLICRMPGEDLSYSLNLADRLRNEGYNTDVYLGTKNLRGQLGYAADLKIPVVLIIGGDEITQGIVTLRDMKKEEQITVSSQEVMSVIKRIINY